MSSKQSGVVVVVVLVSLLVAVTTTFAAGRIRRRRRGRVTTAETKQQLPPLPLSRRGLSASQPPMPYLTFHFAAMRNLFDEGTNPDGLIPLDVAENKLCYADLLLPRLRTAFASSEHFTATSSGANYDDFRGSASFRRSLAAFLGRHVVRRGGVEVDSEGICVAAGVGAVLSTLAQCLCEPGEACLTPAPFYAAFTNDLGLIAGVSLFSFQLEAPRFEITEALLDEAFARAVRAGSRPRLLLITSPNNPLGICHSAEEMQLAIDWVRRKPGMHLVSDEIYACSVFAAREKFVSAAAVCGQRGLGDNCHVLYGFSKDFGVSGFRLGAVYTNNKDLIGAWPNIAYFAGASFLVQELLGSVLRDEAFVDAFLAENCRRLRASYEIVARALVVAGIPFVEAVGGMFVWVDLRHLLLGDSELALFRALYDEAGLILTPGESQRHGESGFFRLCFAWVPPATLTVAMERLVGFSRARVVAV